MPQGGPWLPPHLGSLSCSSDRSHAPPCAGSGVPASPGAQRSLGSGAGAEPWPRRHCARARAGGAALSTGSCGKPRPVHPGAQPAARQLREGTGESRGQAMLRLRVRGAAGTVGHHLRPSPHGTGCAGAGRETQSRVPPGVVFPPLSIRDGNPVAQLLRKRGREQPRQSQGHGHGPRAG